MSKSGTPNSTGSTTPGPSSGAGKPAAPKHPVAAHARAAAAAAAHHPYLPGGVPPHHGLAPTDLSPSGFPAHLHPAMAGLPPGPPHPMNPYRHPLPVSCFLR